MLTNFRITLAYDPTFTLDIAAFTRDWVLVAAGGQECEWHDWRVENPSAPLLECFSWFLCGRLDEYNESLVQDGQIAADIASPEKAFLADSFDMFTLDTTVIGTALGQLIDEGTIDASAKPYVRIAISRQLHPLVCRDDNRRQILLSIERVLETA